MLGDVDLSSGETPDAETLAKLGEAATKLNDTELTAASAEIAAWATKNCPRAASATLRSGLLGLAVGLALADSSIVTLALPEILGRFDVGITTVACAPSLPSTSYSRSSLLRLLL